MCDCRYGWCDYVLHLSMGIKMTITEKIAAIILAGIAIAWALFPAIVILIIVHFVIKWW